MTTAEEHANNLDLIACLIADPKSKPTKLAAELCVAAAAHIRSTANPTDRERDRLEIAKVVNVPDDLGWIAPALMGEEPPSWSAKGDWDQSMKCNAWWATASARYRLLHADALLAEWERTKQ